MSQTAGTMTAQRILDLTNAPVLREQGRNLGLASYQWAMRPPDQRHVSIPALKAAVAARRERSAEVPRYPGSAMEVKLVESGPQEGELYFATFGEIPAVFTNWSMSQFNNVVGGPNIAWLRDMPPPVAKLALNASLKYRQRMGQDGEVKLLVAPPEGDEPGLLRALTSPSYGRIWDLQVVNAVEYINSDGRWVVPGKIAGQGMADMYTEVTKQSTTLYASDRDVWMFLVDEQHPIEIDGEVYFRGFIVSNSEVGDAKFKLMTFLFKAVCMNRCIWGAIQIREFAVRHTSKAPDRFLQEVAPVMAAYSNASTAGIADAVRGAKRVSVAENIKEAQKFLREQGFGQYESQVVPLLAERATDVGSGGDPTNLWDLVMAGTAYAREIEHADTRVEKERQFGGLLDRFAKAA